MEFAIGTTNPEKVREIGGILAAAGCTFRPVSASNPEENGADFLENARIKALAYAQESGCWTISEDSGLIIPALGGLPGAFSARFSDCEVDRGTFSVTRVTPSGRSRAEIDTANNLLVLEMMRGVGDRRASFAVVLVVTTPDGRMLHEGVGTADGTIAQKMLGENGFGYDPIFIGNDTYGKTYAELDSMRKNLRSHRKKVLDAFKAWVRTLPLSPS